VLSIFCPGGFYHMNPEQKVAIVTDSASSMRPEYSKVQELKVSLIPLEISFLKDRKIIPYSDFEITSEELYQKMRNSKTLPQTSGGIIGKAIETYKRLANETNSIISIHITSKHSTAYSSAFMAATQVMETKPELSIEVIDSKSVSLGIWFLAEQAAKLAQQGANLEEIKKKVLETIPKIGFLATPATLKNVIKGGRVPFLKGHAGNFLKIRPILGLTDGKLEEVAKTIGTGRARREIVNKIKNENNQIIKMGVFHTNDPKAAEKVRKRLAKFYSGEIPIYEAGPVIGVHAGEGTVGVVFQKA